MPAKHKHEWAISAIGWYQPVYMGRPTKHRKISEKVEVRCLTCPKSQRIPFERAAFFNFYPVGTVGIATYDVTDPYRCIIHMVPVKSDGETWG